MSFLGSATDTPFKTPIDPFSSGFADQILSFREAKEEVPSEDAEKKNHLTEKDKECELFSQRLNEKFRAISQQMRMLHAMLERGHDVESLIASGEKALDELRPLINQYETNCRTYQAKKEGELLKHQNTKDKIQNTHLNFTSFILPEANAAPHADFTLKDNPMFIGTAQNQTSNRILIGGTSGAIIGGKIAQLVAQKIVEKAENHTLKVAADLNKASLSTKTLAREYLNGLSTIRDIEADMKKNLFGESKPIQPIKEEVARLEASIKKAAKIEAIAEKALDQALLKEEIVTSTSFVSKTVAKGAVGGALAGSGLGFVADMLLSDPAY